MNAPIASDVRTSTTRKRALWEKLLVRGGIAAALVVVVLEWTSQRSYNQSLAAIEAVAKASKADEARELEHELLPAEQLQGVGHGWYIESRVEDPRQEILSWTWPSLFKTYVLQFRLNSKGEVVEFASDNSLVDTAAPISTTLLKVDPLPENTIVVRVDGEPSRVLAREILRQAFLITAQEQFQLATPDAFIQATSDKPGSGKNWPFEISLTDGPGGFLEYWITRLTPEKVEQVFHERLREPHPKIIEMLPGHAEQLMREKFPEILAESKYVPVLRQLKAITPVSPKVIELQGNLDPISQFGALRLLHQQAESEEAAPEVYTKLARGYALLGSLSDMNWSTTHKVYKARSLLWSQRAIQRWPELSEVWATRAYARALCGLPALALDDLKQARELNQGKQSTEGELLASYCLWDLKQLEEAAAQGDRLAEYLWFLALEQVGTPQKLVTVAEQIVQRSPECWRASATLAVMPLLGVRHSSAATGLPQIEDTLPVLMSQLDDLPPSIRKMIPASPQPAKGAAVLERLLVNMVEAVAGDWREPLVGALKTFDHPKSANEALPWKNLGELIDDFQFLQVISILDHQRFQLGMDTSASINRFRPLLRHHPLAGLIDCYDNNLDRSKSPGEKIRPVLETLEFSHGATLIRRVVPYAPQLDIIVSRIVKQFDTVVPDMLRQINQPQHTHTAKNLLAILQALSPECPQVAESTLSLDWEEIEPVAMEWEEKYADSPKIEDELSAKYLALDQLDDALRTTIRWTELAPGYQSFWRLAEVYKRRDDWDGQQRALKEVLKLPSLALEHAQSSKMLAYGHMDRQEWGKAKPYADSAASSYSAWGLICAAVNYEGFRDWEKAEELMRACSERYEGSQDLWYLWCKRTGHGHSARALPLAEQMLNRPTNTDPYLVKLERGVIRHMEGDQQQAYDLISECAEKNDNEYYMMLAAIFANKMGNDAECKKWLQQLADWPYVNGTVLLARNYLKANSGENWAPTDAELDWYAAFNLNDGEPSNAMYFISHILRMLGDDRSTEWLERCAASPVRNKYLVTVAGWELTQSGHDSPQRRGSEIQTEYAQAVNLLIRGQQLMRQSEVETALGRYREAVAISPDFLQAHYHLALIAWQFGHSRESEESFNKLIALAPSISDFYNNRGRFYESLLMPQQAMQDYEMGLQIDPHNKIIHNDLAWLLLTDTDENCRDLPRGRFHAEHSFGRGPKSQSAELELKAVLAAAEGNFDEAIELQQKALEQPSTNDRYMMHERIQHYFKKQLPFVRTPAMVPLIETLPADGTWVRYQLRMNLNWPLYADSKKMPIPDTRLEHRANVTLRSVGRIPRAGDTLRLLELEIKTDSDLIPSGIYRLAIPEGTFGRFRHPLYHAVKMWEGPQNGPVLPLTSFDADPTFSYFLTGVTHNAYKQISREDIDTPAGKLSCEMYRGESLSEKVGKLQFPKWQIVRHPDVPFGLVKATLSAFNDRGVDIVLTLQDQGTGAIPAWGDLLPD